MDNLTKSFLKKHEQLLKEENELKEKLQIAVTKSKESLENYLSTSINDIKLSERLKKGIEKMKDKEENIIKIISYVSKANQTQNQMINLTKQLMQNIKFNFDENKNEKIGTLRTSNENWKNNHPVNIVKRERKQRKTKEKKGKKGKSKGKEEKKEQKNSSLSIELKLDKSASKQISLGLKRNKSKSKSFNLK